MSVTVIIGEDALAPDTWERHDVDDVCAFLAARYDKFPDTARVYHNQVAQNCDVTPSDEWGIKRLQKLDGTLYVIVYPGDPVTIIIAVVAVAAVAAAAFLLLPKIPNSALRNTQTESPNNALSDRQNKPRPNGRIPDIYGTVRSTPDLIAVPYNVFVNHEEVEYAYMCVGRGEYEINEDDIRDDTTPVKNIAGTSVEIYAPYSSPNSAEEPQVRIGLEIDEPVRTAVRSNSVNGQVMRPPNADSYAALEDVRFVYPDEVHVKASSDVDFTELFIVGDTLVISGASTSALVSGSGVNTSRSAKFTSLGTVVLETTNTSVFSVGDTITITGAYFEYNSGANAVDLSGTYVIQALFTDTITLDNPEDTNSDWNLLAANFTSGETSYKTCGFVVPDGQVNVDLSGTYTILGVDTNIITLSNPASVNVDWNTINSFPDNRTEYISPVLETTADKWIGPFILDRNDLTAIYANFVALNGLYKDNGENQKKFDVTVELEATPVDALDVPTGAAETFQAIIEGSSTSRTTRAVTLKASPTFTGRCSVRVRRVTPADLEFEGTVVDEIKWRDVYQMSPVPVAQFGNVTTVHAVTLATSGALSLKDRKLNMLASRKMPQRVGTTSEFTNRNLVDKSRIRRGYYHSVSSARVISNASWRCTAFIPVVPGRRYSYRGADVPYVAYYSDAYDDAFITPASPTSGGGAAGFVVPTGLGIQFVVCNITNEGQDVTTYDDTVILEDITETGSSIGLNYAARSIVASNNVADILATVSLDPRIGNRRPVELDLNNIYDTVAEVAEYFATDLAAEFNYTFDNDNLSYEETVATIASAVFCSAYRRGNVIKLKFDRATDDSVLLFNHRNKLPGTEERTVRFGNQDDNDGVEYNYVDPEDDALVTLYLPKDQTAVNPKKVDSIGVRSYALAYFHAWRIWNKTRYQNVATEFEATQEADLLLVSDRILVADNTRPGTQDGEVIAQNGLSLELSQEITFIGGEDYTIFLQHVDGTVEAIPVTAGASSRLVTLAYAPRAALSLEDDAYARALYQIVAASSRREQAFLVTEKEPQDNFTSVVRAVNYDFSYYTNDGLMLYVNGGIADEGPIGRSLPVTGNVYVIPDDGTRGLCAGFSGAQTSYLNVPGMTAPASYTKAMWANKDDTGTGHVLSSAGDHEAFYILGDGKVGAWHNLNADGVVQYQLPNNAQSWHHIAVTYDATTGEMTLYADGVQVSQAIRGQRPLGELQVGARAGGGAHVGKLDDVRLYNRVLSPKEIATLYRRTL